MGYEERDYFRERAPSPLRRTRAAKLLIVATVVAYIVETVLLGRGGLDVIDLFGVVPGRLVESLWLWQLFTHPFLHAPFSIWHILINMLFLHWFGADLEERYGLGRFLVIYFGGAAGCAALYTGVAYAAGSPETPAIGASGAIMSIMVIAAHLFPRRRILLFFVLPIPLWVLVAGYIAIDVYYPLVGLRSWLEGAGHLGGALFGLTYYWLGLRMGLLERLAEWLPRKRPSRPDAGEDIEVDRILDKIGERGMASLTSGERETLERASRRRGGTTGPRP
jgi:membrane associated rhomboid family serine protease